MKKHTQKASSCRVQFLRHNKTLRHHRMPLQVGIPHFLTLSGGLVQVVALCMWTTCCMLL